MNKTHEKIKRMHQRIDNIEYGIQRMVLYLHIANQEDCTPEAREAFNEYINDFLERNNITIKEIWDREYP